MAITGQGERLEAMLIVERGEDEYVDCPDGLAYEVRPGTWVRCEDFNYFYEEVGNEAARDVTFRLVPNGGKK
jgi:hypothetical protein